MNTIFASGTTVVEENQNYKDVVSEEIYIICDTSDAPCVVVLPAISTEFRNVQFYVSDRSDNANNNNIFIMGALDEPINEQPFIAITTAGGSAAVFVASSNTSDSQGSPVSAKWLAFQSAQQVNPGTGVLGIQAGTNISVDNTDPQYPIVSASGISATGTVYGIPRAKTVSGANVTSYEDSDADDTTTLFSVYKTGDNKQIILRVNDTALSQGAQLSFNAVPGLSSLAFFIDNPSTRRTGITTLQDNNYKLGVFEYDLTPIADLEFSSNGLLLNSPLTSAGQFLKLNNANQIVSQELVIPLTLAQAQLLASNSLVVSGQQYLITDAADLGVVVVGTPNPTQYQRQALGGFLNADFQNTGDYDTIESVTGFAKATFRGIWTPATAAVLLNGDVFIYNNDIWQVTNEGDIDRSGASTPVADPNPYYRFLRVNFTTEQVGYIQAWYPIEFDVDANSIDWVFDDLNNQINGISRLYFQFGNNSEDNVRLLDSRSFINTLNNIGDVLDVQIFNEGTLYCDGSQGNIRNAIVSNGTYTIVLDSGISHYNCIYSNFRLFVFPSDVSFTGKEITEVGSTFTATFDISSLTTIDLSSVNYAGIISLQSTNASENIKNITNSSISSVVLKLAAPSGSFVACDVNLQDNTLGSGNIRVPFSSYYSSPYDNGAGGFYLRLENDNAAVAQLKGTLSVLDTCFVDMDITNNIAKIISTSNYIAPF